MYNLSGVYFVLCLCIPTILCLSEEMQELADMLHSTCQGETGVSEDLIEGARKGNFVDDPNLKCYMKCLFLQMASMNDDGMIDVEATVAMIPEEMKDKVEGTIRKCGTKIGADICDNAFLTNKCYFENNPEYYFLI